jgi:hypothetical protein
MVLVPIAPALLGQPAEQGRRDQQPVVAPPAWPCSRRRFSICSAGLAGLLTASAGGRRRRPSRVRSKPQQLDLGCLAQPVAAFDMEELEQEAVAGVRGDERAASLPAHEDVVGDQVVDRTPQRAHRDAEAGGEQFGLAGECVAGGRPGRARWRCSSDRLTARNSG